MPLRILVFSYFFPPDPSVGAHRWGAMAHHLRALGHEVTVVTTSAWGALPDDGDGVVRTADLQAAPALRRLLRRPPLAVPGRATAVTAPAPRLLRDGLVPDAWIASWVPFALRAGRRALAAGAYDAIVTNGPPDSTHLIGLLLGRRRPAWIADFEDGWRFEPLRPPWPTAAQDRLDSRLEARVAATADIVVGVTRPIAADFRARLAARAEHVTLAWDPRLEDAVARAAPPSLDRSRFNLVHTGALVTPARRDPATLLAALRRLDRDTPLRLVLAGPLSQADRDLLVGLDHVVECVGTLPRPETIALQRRADALLLLATGSHVSQVTGKVFEYLAADRPIVAVAAPSEAAAIVRETGAGEVVDPGDVDAIVALLRRAANGQLVHVPDPERLAAYRFPAAAERFAAVVADAVGLRPR